MIICKYAWKTFGDIAEFKNGGHWNLVRSDHVEMRIFLVALLYHALI